MSTSERGPGPGGEIGSGVDADGSPGRHRIRPGLTSWSENAITPRRTRARGAGAERPIDWIVFGITAVLSLGFVIWGIVATDSLTTVADESQSWVISNTGWLYVAAATYFVVFVIWLAASRYGRIPLGGDDEAPEFRTTSWIAMMFSAGMGIGLMFWGVAEPLSHYVAPPPDTADPETIAAVQTAMATTMFHWALQPWAMYAVVGVAIAYSTFRRGRSQLISSVFRPLLGPRSDGWIGKLIDVLAIFATLFGSAVSLGLGALQIGSGVEFLGWSSEVGTPLLVAIITVLTICFIASAVSGLARGVQALANVNMWLAAALAVFVFVAGPTLFILNMLPTALGDYVTAFTAMASRTDVSGGADMQLWLSQWTIFYWAWWISWTPFVGLFIARISRGRTIRQFVTGVLVVPCLVSLVWFAIFGTAGIDAQRTTGSLTDADGSVNSEFALFRLLEQYPLESITAVLVMLLVAIFFVSGADAASIVMGSLSQHGAIEPSRGIVVFWGMTTGAVAAIMLVLGGSEALTGLQSVTVVTSLPFAVVMVFLTFALAKDLQTDRLTVRRDIAFELVREAVSTGIAEHGPDFAIATAPVTRRRSGEPVMVDPQEEAHDGPPDGTGGDAGDEKAEETHDGTGRDGTGEESPER